jgi:hypothetical protein
MPEFMASKDLCSLLYAKYLVKENSVAIYFDVVKA